MKKTLIALVALSGLAFATDAVTLTPFTSAEGWVFGRADGNTKGQNLTLDTTAGSIYNSDSNWNKSYAAYTLDTPLTVQGSDGIAFDFTMTTQGDLDVCLTLTLIDDNGLALCIGMGKYGAGHGSVEFGMTTDVSKNFYNFKDTTASITAVTSAGTLATLAANDTAAISGLIMMNENNRVVVTLPVSGSETPATLELGENFTLNKVLVSFEGKGKGSVADYPTISGLTLKAPEPATATLSLLALAGLAARRRRH